jgi:hypothetical protein
MKWNDDLAQKMMEWKGYGRNYLGWVEQGTEVVPSISFPFQNIKTGRGTT